LRIAQKQRRNRERTREVLHIGGTLLSARLVSLFFLALRNFFTLIISCVYSIETLPCPASNPLLCLILTPARREQAAASHTALTQRLKKFGFYELCGSFAFFLAATGQGTREGAAFRTNVHRDQCRFNTASDPYARLSGRFSWIATTFLRTCGQSVLSTICASHSTSVQT
jgi:hypothetical protein